VRVLVTGAAGFVGRALCRRLLAEPGLSVAAVVRDGRGGGEPRYTEVQADLAAPGWTRSLPEQVDVVVHLAQSRRYREFPAGAPDMVAVNVDAAFELVHWAASHAVRRFLLASTGNVYRPSQAPLDEEAPCEPTSLYAATKLSAEHLVRQYAGLIEVSVLRLFGVYGPGQRGMLVPAMIDRVRRGEEVVLAGGIGLYLTPLHVGDCVEMLLCAARAGSQGHGVYNLCGGEGLSLREIVELIGAAVGCEPRVRATDGVPQSLIGNGARFERVFGYRPRVSFRDAIGPIVREYPGA
jgi:UDP-glucose 4-epimerase